MECEDSFQKPPTGSRQRKKKKWQTCEVAAQRRLSIPGVGPSLDALWAPFDKEQG